MLRTRANVAYTDALHGAGLRPFILPVLDPDDADGMLEGMAGLLLTGGEDVDPVRYRAAPHAALGDVHEARDSFELALVRAAFRRRLPTLAICRGIQIANVALGGTLVQDLPSEWHAPLAHDNAGRRDDRVHEVTVVPGSRLARALGTETLSVNSFHHQAVRVSGNGLRVVARAPDGVVEGMEWADDDWWLAAVQWHPEELTAGGVGWDRALFLAFGAAARAGFSSPVASGLRS